MVMDKTETIQIVARQRYAQSLAEHVADSIGMAEAFALNNLYRPGIERWSGQFLNSYLGHGLVPRDEPSLLS